MPAVRNRPGGGGRGGPQRLDQALKGARQHRVHLPHHELEVDEQAVRRAVRWGKAEDHRVATLDQVMKQRRTVERQIKSQLASGGVTLAPPAAAPARAEESSASKQLIVWSIVLATLVIGAMVVVAIKLL